MNRSGIEVDVVGDEKIVCVDCSGFSICIKICWFKIRFLLGLFQFIGEVFVFIGMDGCQVFMFRVIGGSFVQVNRDV